MAVIVMTSSLPYTSANSADNIYDMNISINVGGEQKEISPYIYGVNQYGNENYLSELNVNSIRQGGNRMTGYNWENNASNAGSDWKYSSDNNLSSSNEPADCVQKLSTLSNKHSIDYKLTTLQLAGYVAADKNGTVTESEAAPSPRWNETILTKTAAFDVEPDLTDGKVYMNEYVNYIIKKLGNSQTSTGIQGYSLDNEPALWHHTHSRIHPEPVGIEELQSKSIEMATAVKKLDPDAEIFGPALYGYTAFDHLADDEEWKAVKAAKGYNWYLDCYLDAMKKASDEQDVRLLDVLDIHYYSESSRVGAEDRVQSVRTLYEDGFVENSWIGQWCQNNIPILPTIQKSIDKYYPGTKLAISEYNFGGTDTSGTIAQAEALGCYADAGVYLATLWGTDPYICSGIKLYTNYDGKKSTFGDTLIPAKTEDVSLASTYASIDGTDKGTVKLMLTNKDFVKDENAHISIDNSNTDYKAAAVYAVYGDSSEIKLIDIVEDFNNNSFDVTLPELSAAMIVVTDDVSDFDGLSIYTPKPVEEKKVTFSNPESLINAKGFIEVPIEDAEHLKKIEITADVSTEMGSSWATAGCAVCMNAKDSNGLVFWTSKSYNLAFGTGSSAVVEFDGTLLNSDEPVQAVIADGKVELQKWWDASEKQDSGDIVNVAYKSITVVYEYPISSVVLGDANGDGLLDNLDLVCLCQHLIKDKFIDSKFAENADINKDKVIDIADLAILKQIIMGDKIALN